MVQVGSQKQISILLIFIFMFLIAKIWLNEVMDDRNLGYITELKKKMK
jgi:hypothetical protein